uniref:Cold-shock protein n=1 Tax=Ascaris lumbricoides TaxID=6252 RepID=A0A0M3HGI6_ASCLU
MATNGGFGRGGGFGNNQDASGGGGFAGSYDRGGSLCIIF